MINVHLNGEVIRCPDIAAIHRRALEIKDKHKICRYNYLESDCQAWQKSLTIFQTIKRTACAGRCTLFCTNECPGHLRQLERGNKQKTFKIDGSVYRKLASSAHYLVKESETKTLFITLTFPQFKKKHKLTKHIFENEIINSYFSKFVHNLHENYNCGGYIAVRERGKKGNRIHFHLLLSIPFVAFSILNDTWCNTIKDICFYSSNALTSDPKTLFIRNPVRAMRYVCKYFAKGKGQVSESRLVFMSNNIIQRPKKVYDTIESILSGYKSIYIEQTSDYSTRFRITDAKEFNRFCENFLYPFFELTVKKPQNLYSFPENSS